MGVGANVFERRFDSACCTVEGSHITPSPPAAMAAQMLRRTGKWMWRPEHVVRVAGTGGVAGGGTVGVASAGWLKLLFPRSIPLRM
jgi:hypothetical protein